mmetsp:Transcript_5895/g.12145  ORF Transcript_5895/g.12145 Transcript_5895/m.12145 type:complete len:292 (+) Transcript_5895:151-1026(+)|eukprot:CAMPEP_0197275264 /NCGR_PEP_ID=MMETSP1432-20130617/13696_1 /TAXON_ID=44447 /ORGANISM="Pseudo-nitzschia delicatissima, Strain UNC1205" /LENGTH=291 /DNA_ID=CAMNT_0042741147 /DNA_START=116 /DNA_END=991 /DNA_ORIENTATION=+
MSCWSEPNSKHAFALSWVSTIVTVGFAITGVVYYVTTGSAMCLVFGLENFVDFLSSVVVLWRFWASGNMTKEREKILKRRDLRASMAISIIMIILGMGIIATSSHDVTVGPEGNLQDLEVVLGMAVMSIFVFGCLSLFKFQYANALSSESLYKDAVCSLIGTVLGAALFTNTLIIRSKPQIWWLDPMVAMVCGFTALFLGLHSMYVAWKIRRVPIFALSWWTMSRGDGMPYRKSDRAENIEEGRGDNRNKKKKTTTKKTKTKKPKKKTSKPTKKIEVEMKPVSTNLSNEVV